MSVDRGSLEKRRHIFLIYLFIFLLLLPFFLNNDVSSVWGYLEIQMITRTKRRKIKKMNLPCVNMVIPITGSAKIGTWQHYFLIPPRKEKKKEKKVNQSKHRQRTCSPAALKVRDTSHADDP